MKMQKGTPINVEITLRHYHFSRDYAIRDIYDALVELITNSDDSYHRLYNDKHRGEDGGSILIEILEQRKGEPSLLKIYDRAEGMTLESMRDRLCRIGDRKSQKGDRGFMGRGAKDCTVLGKMTANSSPPYRAAVSICRMHSFIFVLTCLMTLSPARCPYVSLSS